MRKFFLSKLKWYQLYYVLAAFDVLTVAGSLYLNHSIMSIYEDSVSVNAEWATTLSSLSRLSDLATEVNAPGNDVFDDGDVALHRTRRDAALLAYRAEFEQIRERLASIDDIDETTKFELVGLVMPIRRAMRGMTEEADGIFSLFEQARVTDAGKRMATMDRKAAVLLVSISALKKRIQALQVRNFDEQLANASMMRSYEYLIAFAIGLMIIMVTVYGHKLALKIRQTQEALEKSHSALQAQAELLAESEYRSRSVLEAVADGILIVDEQGVIEQVNPAVEKCFGYRCDELIGENIKSLIPGLPDSVLCPLLEDQDLGDIKDDGSSLEFTAHRVTGDAIDVELSMSSFEIAGSPKFTGVIRDVTEKKRAQERMRFIAMTDALTGLANRHAFTEEFSSRLQDDQAQGKYTVLMLLDLDRFKAVNDSYGHHIGDALLQEVASRMRAVFRENDLLARLGGDEFAVVLGDLNDKSVVFDRAKRLITSLGQTYVLDGVHIDTAASIGIAISPDHSLELDELLRMSDMALYTVKNSGRNHYQLFELAMMEKHNRTRQIEHNLKLALQYDQFRLFYQPQINVVTGEVHGMEALIRWEHPRLGLVSPGEFIPVAENSNLIKEIGNWVITEACRFHHRLQENGINLVIAVNVSARQLDDPKFLESMETTLSHQDVPGNAIEIELTETAALEDLDGCANKIAEFQRYGHKFAIDDFGTGNSSIEYLRRLPVDCVKIDRSFVAEIEEDKTHEIITESLIKLASKLGMEVIAEGVETESVRNRLKSMGCSVMQGYLFDKPLPADAFLKRMAAYKRKKLA